MQNVHVQNTAGFNGFVVWRDMLEISDMLLTLDLRGIGLAELVGGAVIQGSGMHTGTCKSKSTCKYYRYM